MSQGELGRVLHFAGSKPTSRTRSTRWPCRHSPRPDKRRTGLARSAPSTIHWCIDQPAVTVRRDSLVCCGSVEILWFPQFLQFFEFFEFEI